MNQSQLANSLDCTPQHFNAVIKGRTDAGKKLASKLVTVVGGSIEIWMFRKYKPNRKPLVDSYLAAFKKAHLGNN